MDAELASRHEAAANAAAATPRWTGAEGDKNVLRKVTIAAVYFVRH
jgi:hypothetical protein